MEKIINIIGSPVAISPNKASLLYEHFIEMVNSGTKTVYSFESVQDCSSAFCNASVGKLYMNFDPELVSSLISFVNFDEEGIWNEKINRAKFLGSEENHRNNSEQALEEILA